MDEQYSCNLIGFSLDLQNRNFGYANRMPLWVLAMRHNAVTPHHDSMDEKIKSNRHELTQLLRASSRPRI